MYTVKESVCVDRERFTFHTFLILSITSHLAGTGTSRGVQCRVSKHWVKDDVYLVLCTENPEFLWRWLAEENKKHLESSGPPYLRSKQPHRENLMCLRRKEKLSGRGSLTQKTVHIQCAAQKK